MSYGIALRIQIDFHRLIIHIIVNIERATTCRCAASFRLPSLLGNATVCLDRSAIDNVLRGLGSSHSLCNSRLTVKVEDGLGILVFANVKGALGLNGVELAEFIRGPNGRADGTCGR